MHVRSNFSREVFPEAPPRKSHPRQTLPLPLSYPRRARNQSQSPHACLCDPLPQAALRALGWMQWDRRSHLVVASPAPRTQPHRQQPRGHSLDEDPRGEGSAGPAALEVEA